MFLKSIFLLGSLSKRYIYSCMIGAFGTLLASNSLLAQDTYFQSSIPNTQNVVGSVMDSDTFQTLNQTDPDWLQRQKPLGAGPQFVTISNLNNNAAPEHLNDLVQPYPADNYSHMIPENPTHRGWDISSSSCTSCGEEDMTTCELLYKLWVRASGNYVFISRGEEDTGFGINHFEVNTSVAVPISRRTPLIVTPGYAIRTWDAPAFLNLPNQVNDAYVDFSLRPKFSERWSGQFHFSPGYYSDGEASSDDALRLIGRGMAIWQQTPTVKWYMGVAYLDRQDYNILPIAGLVWEPTDVFRADLIFPKPRVSRRLWHDCCKTSWWGYIAGEFGGGNWAVQRAPGVTSKVNYGDLRLSLGFERVVEGGSTFNFEVGYVWDREIEILDENLIFNPDDAFLLRAGLIF